MKIGILIAAIIVQWTNSAPVKPNIVLIYTDDQGYGDVSAINENAKFNTPNMDRIVNEGAYFSDAHTTAGICTPSRYGILTGRYNWRTTMKKSGVGYAHPCLIENGRMTLASLLKENGYHTAMIGKWHLGMQFPGNGKGRRDWSQPITDGPLEKGFDYYFGVAASMNYGMLTYIEGDSVLEEPSMWTRKKIFEDVYDTAPQQYRMMAPYDAVQQNNNDLEVAPSFADSNVLKDFADRTIKWIGSVSDDAKNGKPFFVYMPLTSPHLPHSTAGEFIGTSNAGVYGDFMQDTDYRVGQVLNTLDSLGLTNNTLVILSSDNGPENNWKDQITYYDHYSSYVFRDGKRSLYEGGHRVPFLVRWPGVVAPGRKIDATISQADILATFADMLDVTIPNRMGEDSYSFLSALVSDDYPKPLRAPIIMHQGGGRFGIRMGDWKLHMTSSPKLYNLVSDIGEEDDVYAQNKEIADSLQNILTSYILAGRSTRGTAVSNDGGSCWEVGLSEWLPACDNSAEWDSLDAIDWNPVTTNWKPEHNVDVVLALNRTQRQEAAVNWFINGHKLMLFFSVKKSNRIKVEILNLKGQPILSNTYTSEGGNNLSPVLDMTGISGGVYLLRVGWKNTSKTIKIWM